MSSSGDDPIELFNPGASPVTLDGWTVTDENDAPTQGVYTLPVDTALAAGGFLVLTKGTHHAFGVGGEDAVKLRDADGTLIDHLAWPDGAADLSYCLSPDGGTAAQSCPTASFGNPND